MGQAAVSFLLCEITERQNVSGSARKLKTRLNKTEGATQRRKKEGGQKDIGRKEGGGGDLEEFWDLLGSTQQRI